MEVLGTAIIIILMIIFGIGALANAFEASERRNFDKSDVKYNDGDNT